MSQKQSHLVYKDFFPTLIIVRGYPGSGKSTLVQGLMTDFQSSLVDPDMIDAKEFESYCAKRSLYDSKFISLSATKKLYRYNTYQALKSLRNSLTTFWVQAWTSISGIEQTIENIMYLMPLNSPLAFVLVEVKVPFLIASARNTQRYDNGIKRLLPIVHESSYYMDQETYNGDAFKLHAVIDNTSDIKTGIEELRGMLREYLIPKTPNKTC